MDSTTCRSSVNTNSLSALKMALFSQFFYYFLLHFVVVHHSLLTADAQKLETNFPEAINPPDTSDYIYQLRMKNALPTAARLTQCTGFVLVPEAIIYINQLKGYAPSTTVHHLVLYGCNYRPETPCACSLKSRSTIFISAKNTPAFRIPDINGFGAAFAFGGSSSIQYVFLEVHYKKELLNPDSTTGVDLYAASQPSYFVGIYSVMGVGTIQPETSTSTLDTCVTYSDVGNASMLVFGYQVHTHSFGTSVSVYSDDGYYVSLIGRGNPQFPQAFYPYRKGSYYTVWPGAILMVRCTYNTIGQSSPIYTIGVTGKVGSEMCFANLLYVRSDTVFPPINPFFKEACNSAQTSKFPADSTSTFAPINTLELHALYGNQTGTVSIDSTQTMNLDLETF